MRTLKILTLAILLLGLPLIADAGERSSVLAGDGTIFSVHSGSYGDLFPSGSAAPPGWPVLALDVQRSGVALERLLVEGTGDEAVDDDALLFFEDSSETLFLLWQQSAPGGDATLVISGLRGGEWSDRIEVAGTSASQPGSSSLAITRDSFETEVAGRVVTSRRTVLHLVWQAGSTVLGAEPSYTAVVLEDGEFIGFNSVVRLADLVPDDDGGTLEAPALSIEAGVDTRAVIVGFSNPRTGRIVTIESRLLPMELGSLALHEAREVISAGRELPPGAGLGSLADIIRSSIIDIGYRFHFSLTTYLANETEALIVDVGSRAPGPGVSLESIAEPVGRSIIEMGLQVFGNDGMNREFEADRLHTLAISSEGHVDLGRLYEAAKAPHLIRLYVVSNRPAPAAGEGEVVVVNSETGESSIVSWAGEGDTIQYRQSAGETWSAPQTLSLGEGGLDREGALQILRDRVRKR